MFKSSHSTRRLKRRRFRKRYNRSFRRAPLAALLSVLGFASPFYYYRVRLSRGVLVPSFPLPESVFMQVSEIIALLAQFAQQLPSDAQPSFQQTLETLSECCEKLEQRRERDEQTLRFIQFALENLRVDAKYLAFDLEATRRENARLNQLLETFLNNER
jgi:hypothetical protein